MKILNVAEKPSIAKQLLFALNGSKSSTSLRSFSQYNPVKSFEGQFQNHTAEIIITSVIGHIKEFYYKNDYGWRCIEPQKLLIEEQIDQRVAKDKLNIAKNLKKFAAESNILFLWLDCDREGEAIAYEVIEICKSVNQKLQILRAKFSSTSPAEMRNAFYNPIEPDEKQKEGVLARQELDLRSGATFTRFLTISIGDNFDLNKNKLSYGTCQIPTLSFIVQRYLEIKNFQSRPFYYISLVLKKDNVKTNFSWSRNHFFEKYVAAAIYSKTMKNPVAKIISVDKKNKTKFKPYPLSTIEFQKMASIYLNLSSKQAMDIAEKLYQEGFISYPRTETNRYPNSTNFEKILRNLQENEDYSQYLNGFDFELPRKGKNDDKAHPPIHPIKNFDQDRNTTKYKVYDLISRRFIANCSSDAKTAEVQVTADVNGELFTVKGVQILEKNYLDIYEKFDKFKEKKIPSFEVGEIHQPKELLFKEGKTEPPKLLSESDLISTMDKNKIGTDATIHEHIDKIIRRQYVKKIKKLFYPTQIGVALILTLKNLNLSIDNPLLRAETEVQIQRICDGKLDRETMIKKFLQIMNDDYMILKQQQEQLIRVFIQSFNDYKELGQSTQQIPLQIKLPQFNSKSNYYADNSNDTDQQSKNILHNFGKCECKKQNLIILRSQKGILYVKCPDFKHCNKFYFIGGGPFNQLEKTEQNCDLCDSQIITFKLNNTKETQQCNSKKGCQNSIISHLVKPKKK